MLEELQHTLAGLTGKTQSSQVVEAAAEDLPSHALLEQIGYETPDQTIPLDQIKVVDLASAEIVINYMKGEIDQLKSDLAQHKEASAKLVAEFKRVHPNADL